MPRRRRLGASDGAKGRGAASGRARMGSTAYDPRYGRRREMVLTFFRGEEIETSRARVAVEVRVNPIACISMPRKCALASFSTQHFARRVLRPEAIAAGCFGGIRARVCA